MTPRSPSRALLPLFLGGSPEKIELHKKNGTLLTSLLEDTRLHRDTGTSHPASQEMVGRLWLARRPAAGGDGQLLRSSSMCQASLNPPE